MAVAFRANPPADGEARELIVEADGGSRGNPGVAAGGSVVIDPVTGEVLAELGVYVGITTNNVAEYNGMMAGVRRALEIDPQAVLHVRLDSKLVVEQMSGRWKIKNAALADLAAEARSILAGTPVSFEWIPRAENSRADRLANESMDKKASFAR
ncbi:MAG TPA: reverse transcriptase-like protein [Pseudolysinimonas sp.]